MTGGTGTTVRSMVDEPRNAASEIARAYSNLYDDDERFDELMAGVADDFVLQDRRKLVGGVDLDKAAFGQVRLFFMREASLESRHREVLAVRGDRLVLTRILDRYRNGSVREFLGVGDFGGDPVQLRRTVLFGPDDVDAATAELDRLHAEIEADDS